MYSITDRASFESLRRHLGRIPADRPVMIVGNKCDLSDVREVAKGEGENFALSCRAGFKETSAKMRVNVPQTVYDLVRRIRGLHKSKEKSGCVLF